MISAEILREYKEVLSRKKFKLTQEQLNLWYEFLDNATVLISSGLEIDFSRDQKDAKFLACAVESNFPASGIIFPVENIYHQHL
ncbi:MAG: putative toxin-antitoxin system toxin component, PIN family [Nostocales cyanobacterium 94392]|nr:putative toxin-antitoxin system toxin component, PIN family [Nostocales cyanobacterium 94392]